MNKIELTYKIESTDEKTKISPIEGKITHGIKIDKQGKENLVEPKTLAQAVNFLLTALRAIDLSQFKGKLSLRVNGYKVSEKMLKCKVWDWDALFPKESAIICATIAALDSSLTQQWGKECNIYGKPNEVLDNADISTLSSEVIKKANFLTTLRKEVAVPKVWSPKERQIFLAHKEAKKEIRKIENSAKKALSK